jgi:hypothetical protein
MRQSGGTPKKWEKTSNAFLAIMIGVGKNFMLTKA